MSGLRDEQGAAVIRERTVLTVFDHSGPEPVPVEEREVVMEHGRVVLAETRHHVRRWDVQRPSPVHPEQWDAAIVRWDGGEVVEVSEALAAEFERLLQVAESEGQGTPWPGSATSSAFPTLKNPGAAT